jgi:hypothetical protein
MLCITLMEKPEGISQSRILGFRRLVRISWQQSFKRFWMLMWAHSVMISVPFSMKV